MPKRGFSPSEFRTDVELGYRADLQTDSESFTEDGDLLPSSDLLKQLSEDWLSGRAERSIPLTKAAEAERRARESFVANACDRCTRKPHMPSARTNGTSQMLPNSGAVAEAGVPEVIGTCVPGSCLACEQNPASDEALCRRAEAGDEEAIEILLRRYRNLLRNRAALYFIPGAEQSDLIQEGMIGLLRAIRAYDPSRGLPFAALAANCVENSLIDAVRAAGRQKNRILNESLSLDATVQLEDGRIGGFGDTIDDKEVSNPRDLLVRREASEVLQRFMVETLSVRERRVLAAYSAGLSYREIADELQITVKGVDGSLQRARRKLAEFREKQD